MTTVVFGSCINVAHDEAQPVWREALAHQPEWLILCGDNVYMDYGLTLYQPRKWSVERFATEMLARYTTQFAVVSFRKLVSTIPAGQVIGVWDDHDFAWNDCFGTLPDDDMPRKRMIARAMHHHYFRALNQRPLPKSLPPLTLAEMDTDPGLAKDTYRALDLGPLRVLLCDVRSYREKNRDNPAVGSLLGAEQEQWLFREIAHATRPLMIVSGSTMTEANDQAWDYFRNFYLQRFLPAVKDKLTLFLAGDVHENRLPPRVDGQPIEIVSSGAALGVFAAKRNFGVLEISDRDVKVFLYKRGAIQHTSRIDLEKGRYKTSVQALMRAAKPMSSTVRARAQKRAALAKLMR